MTPFDVAIYRLKIIRNMIKGKLTATQAEKIQNMTDKELTYLIRRNG
jgi:hypothetical protein